MIIKKALKYKLDFFLSNLIPFYGKDYEKEKGSGTMWLFESGKLGNEGGKITKISIS